MTRLSTCLGASTLIWITACSCQPENSLGQIEDEDPTGISTHDIGQYLGMAATPDQDLVISFYDREKGALAFARGVVSGESVDWTYTGLDGYPDDVGLDPGDRGKYTSIAVASDGAIWIAYHDVTAGVLRTATCPNGGTSWELGVGDAGTGASPNTGRFASIALDAEENPVIAHYQSDKQLLRIAHYNGSSFTGETVDEGTDNLAQDTGAQDISADVGKYANLAIADDGTEYIAYYDAAHGDLKLATGTAGAYTISTVDSEGDVGAWPDILLHEGKVIIAYQDLGNQDLKLARRNGTNWNLETLDEGDYVGADSAVFMNGSYPAVWYFEGHDNNVKLAQQAGSEWTTDNWAGDEAALGYHLETATLDSTVWVGSYDYTNRTLWFDSL